MAGLRKHFFSLVLMAALVCDVSAQQHSYAHYDVHDGLAGSTVYGMAQDKEGFIWFATETGLSRFDGTHFRNFTTRDGLPDNEILQLFVDSRNRIWLIPFKNTIAYYWKGVFHNRENDSILRKISDSVLIDGIAEDADGNMLLQSLRHLYVLDISGRIRPVKNTDPMPAYIKIGVDHNGWFNVFYENEGGYTLGYVDGDTLIKRRSAHTHTLNSPSIIYLGPDLQFWQQNDSTLFRVPGGDIEFKIPHPPGLISISYLNAGAVMLNTSTQSYFVDIRQKKITDSFLQGELISAVIEDSEGDTWFSTLGNGVYRMGSAYIKNYFFRVGNNQAAVFLAKRVNNHLYVGTDRHGLFRIDLRTGIPEGPWIIGEMTRGRITHLLAVDSQSLILGTDIGWLPMRNMQVKYPKYADKESIKSLQLTDDSLVLVASHLCVLEETLKDRQIVDSIWKDRATCAYKASDGAYYIGTLRGLYCRKKGLPPVFLGDKWPVLTSRVNVICEGPDGTLWFATNGDGLVGYRNGRIIAHIMDADGLTSNICRTLLLTDGYLWIGTDKGLNKLSLRNKTRTIIPYTMADGLPSDMINTVYVEGSEVYIGTPEGLTYFDERNISKRSACNLRITGVTVSERSWPEDTTGFILPHKDNNISFSYAGISFKSAGNISYSYRLLGLDSIWKTTRETFISYPSLPSGDYELQLTATNKYGVQSRMASINFTVAKLLWEKLWFWALVLLSMSLCLFLLFSYRLKRIRRKEAEKADVAARMAELEQMALRSQMNPHFIFNCLNSIQQYVIYKDVPGANDFISKFSHLIRTTLKISTCEAISLEEEEDYIRTYISLEKKRFDNKFNYEIVIGPEVDVNRCYIPPMILQPYIENAIRHGIGLRKDNLGELEVRMEHRQGYLVCVIEDNGVGRKVAAQFKSRNAINYQSVGMSLVARRIEMYNLKAGGQPARIHIEDLVDHAGVGSGTRVSIMFPLDLVLM